MIDLTGKNTLVTGASRGIGRAIAIGYAKAGANVALLARGAEAIDETASEIEELGRRPVRLVCDVEDAEQIEKSVCRAAAELGPLDAVVNNAGGFTCGGPFLQLTHDQWQQEFRLNFDSVLHVCRVAGRMMTERGSGSIINMASVVGGAGLPNYAPYAASKAAVISLTRSLAAEWAPSGVRVNCISPGWIETDLTQGLVADEMLSERLLHVVPVGRFGMPDDVVGLAVFMASDSSQFMTGSSVVVDGGISSYYGGSAVLNTPVGT